MSETIQYNRENAVRYARKWALSQNSLFYDFSNYGGNCTSFVSQCVFAGTCQMNFFPTFGWFYISANDRTPAWTGVEFFYNFITGNRKGIGNGLGPFGIEVGADDLELGDVIQLGHDDGDFYHSLIVTGFSRRSYLVCAHSLDALDRPLYTYGYRRIRFLHIEAVRTDNRQSGICFERLINGESLVI